MSYEKIDGLPMSMSLWGRLRLRLRPPIVRDVIPAGTLFRYEDEDGEPAEVTGVTNMRTRKQWIEHPDGVKIVNASWGDKDEQPELAPPWDR